MLNDYIELEIEDDDGNLFLARILSDYVEPSLNGKELYFTCFECDKRFKAGYVALKTQDDGYSVPLCKDDCKLLN